MHNRFEEGLKVVLAVNVHQQATEGLEDGERSRPPVDMDTVPSRARQDAPENQLGLSALQEILLLEQPRHRAPSRQGEDPRDFGFFSPGPDQIGRGAPPYQEIHRIHEDGFPGARFAGEDRETVRKLQLDRVDDGEIADAEFCQHTG